MNMNNHADGFCFEQRLGRFGLKARKNPSGTFFVDSSLGNAHAPLAMLFRDSVHLNGWLKEKERQNLGVRNG